MKDILRKFSSSAIAVILIILLGFGSIIGLSYYTSQKADTLFGMKENIHHLTVNGMVEAQEETSCGIMEVYPDRLWLKGYGDQKDYSLEISK